MGRSIFGSTTEVLNGVAVFAGTRVRVRSLLDHLESGQTIEEFLVTFPAVTREQAVACLDQMGDGLALASHDGDNGSKKDIWDKLGTITTLIASVVIGGAGVWATHVFNTKTLDIQVAQELNAVYPYISSDDARQRE